MLAVLVHDELRAVHRLQVGEKVDFATFSARLEREGIQVHGRVFMVQTDKTKR